MILLCMTGLFALLPEVAVLTGVAEVAGGAAPEHTTCLIIWTLGIYRQRRWMEEVWKEILIPLRW
jgi:hypothetical protein